MKSKQNVIIKVLKVEIFPNFPVSPNYQIITNPNSELGENWKEGEGPF